MLLDVVEEVVGVAAVERVDGPAEEVEVDDERDAVRGGGECAGGHERPVEAVGAGEEALEGDGGGGRVGIFVVPFEPPRVGVFGMLRCGGGVGGGADVCGVGGGRLRRLGGLGDGRERLHVRRGPTEEPPRDHGWLGFVGHRVAE